MSQSSRPLDYSTSLSISNSRSSRVPLENRSGAQHTEEGLRAFDAESSAPSHATAIEFFVATLHDANLPGPVVLMDETETPAIIGRGGQFIVHRQLMNVSNSRTFSTSLVAVKIPRLSLDPDVPLGLADRNVQKHLHDMYLEVLALTNPKIRSDPHVARLLAWSYDHTTLHARIFLVMELAHSSLGEFLQGNAGGPVAMRLKYQFCQDIAAGVDVLHECGLIHGDLKPDNILIFPNESSSYTAKVADFGLAIADAMVGTSINIRGTYGWQAPEVESEKPIAHDLWQLTDNYSFGLVVWSVLLHEGHKPPKGEPISRGLTAKGQMETLLAADCPLDVKKCMVEAVSKLLVEDPSHRLLRLQPLFCEWQEADQDESETLGRMNLSSDDSSVSEFDDDSFDQSHYDGPYYPWETPAVNQIFIRHLYSRISSKTKSMTADMLFGMFLGASAWPNELANSGLDVLLLAADRGCMAARGVVSTVASSHGAILDRQAQARLCEWRTTSASSGSLLAKRELAVSDLETLAECEKLFQARGGYAALYGSFDTPQQHQPIAQGRIYSHLHWLATYGSQAELKSYLEEAKEFEIDMKTDNEETAVYLACARGSWEALQLLLSFGAKCSIKCTRWSISCLHWAFAFEEYRQAQVVSCLVDAGARIHTMTIDTTPFLHYPFILPPGTPLHWAVATGSHIVVEALYQAGADVLARDGYDIYEYDDRVRHLTKFGGPNMEAYSVPQRKVEGLSALDYAALSCDPFIFELLLRHNAVVHINDTDEEGLSVLHRLSTSPRRRTRTGAVFSNSAFKGAPSGRHEDLTRILEAIMKLGGDIELLTTPLTTLDEKSGRDFSRPRYTPLMMAAAGAAVELVEALLLAGAKVNAVNNKGRTALMCLSEDLEAAAKIISILVAHGADVNHIDENGATPLFCLPGYRMLDTVEFLLGKGADIEPGQSPVRNGINFSIFGRLQTLGQPYNDSDDRRVERILQAYVFSCADGAKKRRVIEDSDDFGYTLLHRYARSGMQHCVRALLSHNATVNAVNPIQHRTYQNGIPENLTWHETPLDTAEIEKERHTKTMQGDTPLTLEENLDILSKLNAVISILQEAGGISCRHKIKREPDD